MEGKQLHVVFLPAMAPGHMTPLVCMARLFAAHNDSHPNKIRVTIITTPMNALRFKTTIDRDIQAYGHHINIETLPFPWAEVGLSQGLENVSHLPTHEMFMKLFYAASLLRPKIENLIRQLKPDCIVSDAFFPWTAHLAHELGIPRIGFAPTFFFTASVGHCIQHYEPQNNVESDTDPFVIPGLPDKVMLTKSELPYNISKTTNSSTLSELFKQTKEAEEMTFGMIMNSFYELESAYADYYRNVMGIKAWHVGPVSLFCKNKINGKLGDQRGGEKASDVITKDNNCLTWLDSKEPESVLYVCFGSLNQFSKAQLREIACALEKTGYFFVWVVGKVLRKQGDEDGDDKEWWLPEKFQEKVKESGKGMIITGWAPQELILEHKATGGFMTHAGTNSVLECVIAGLPMVTWPLYADQFQNEKLVTQVWKCGFPVGNLKWKGHSSEETDLIKREDIEKAISKVMATDDEDADKMRKTARQLSELARKAVEDGGSSANDLKTLIEEIRAYVKK